MIKRQSSGLALLVLTLLWCAPEAIAATGEEVQERITKDLREGGPVVVHVVVALCDNRYQGIVPVPAHLGNGQEAGANLYWGALYGVRTFLSRKAGWRIVESVKNPRERVLERVVLHTKLKRDGVDVEAYVVADAWDGKEIRAVTDRFMAMAAGHHGEKVVFKNGESPVTLSAGGNAHVIAYVGHNGLMDFELEHTPTPLQGAQPRSSLVLACASRPYFLDHLRKGGSHPLLLTSCLMAPEAYSLDAALRAWIAGQPATRVRDAAASAYHKYQKCGLKGATRLFAAGE
jgi:hypothetical protein